LKSASGRDAPRRIAGAPAITDSAEMRGHFPVDGCWKSERGEGGRRHLRAGRNVSRRVQVPAETPARGTLA
jgi:hypothetical protein